MKKLWAIMLNDQIEDFVDYFPEGKYHESFEFVEVPEYLSKYITTDYKFENGFLIPPSKEYLQTQLKSVMFDNTNSLSGFVLYLGKVFHVSLLPTLALFKSYETVYLDIGESQIAKLEHNEIAKLLNFMLDYEQKINKYKFDLNLVIENFDYSVNIEECIHTFEELFAKELPQNNVEEEEQ